MADELMQGVTAQWAEDVLDFWLRLVGPEGWWSHSDVVDKAIRDQFADLWAARKDQPAETFLGHADEALAAIILFDQFPRNMFRGSADAFSTDPLAQDIAHAAVARSYDTQMGGDARMFFYMPFQHSEKLEDQALSLAFFKALGQPVPLDYARRHHDMIARFGRFPHRNKVLGRADRPGEEEATKEGENW